MLLPIRFSRVAARAAVLSLSFLLLVGCAARQAQDSLTGATAQRLLSHSVNDLVQRLPAEDFAALRDRRVHLQSHFVADDALRRYADRRLAVALARRFDLQVVGAAEAADATINVFYTALGTNRDTKGFYLPLGFVPGLDEGAQIDLLTLEQFHGIAEMYYFVGATGTEDRGPVIQSRTRSDAIGLPITTIPINDMQRD